MNKIYTNANERNDIIRLKLVNALKYAYENSPFYYDLFNCHGVKPSDITSPENLLETLPIIDKNHLIDSIPPKGHFEFFSANTATNTVMYTSGSTGMPKIIAMSDTDLHTYEKDCRIMYRKIGIKKDDVVLDMYPFGINASGIMSWAGFKKMGVQVIPLGVSPFPPKEFIIQTHKPTVLFGLTSYIERIAFDLENNGASPDNLGIRTIVVGGESSTKEKKEKISKLYNADVFDIYGTTEFGAVGVDCHKKRGMHVMDDSVLVQIVDPTTHKEVDDGKKGNVILTKLMDKSETPGTILINYFIGDESRIISRDTCGCGELYTIIDYPRRADGAVFVSGAKIDYHDLESIISNPANRDLLTGDFEIIVDSNEDGTDKVICRIEPRPGAVIPERYAERIADAWKSINYPLANEVSGGRIDLSVHLVKGSEFEICKKPGKPKRILDYRKE